MSTMKRYWWNDEISLVPREDGELCKYEDVAPLEAIANDRQQEIYKLQGELKACITTNTVLEAHVKNLESENADLKEQLTRIKPLKP